MVPSISVGLGERSGGCQKLIETGIGTFLHGENWERFGTGGEGGGRSKQEVKQRKTEVDEEGKKEERKGGVQSHKEGSCSSSVGKVDHGRREKKE